MMEYGSEPNVRLIANSGLLNLKHFFHMGKYGDINAAVVENTKLEEQGFKVRIEVVKDGQWVNYYNSQSIFDELR